MNEPTTDNRRYALAAVGALTALIITIIVLVVNTFSHADPKDTVTAFFAAWKAGEYDAAAQLTDGDPASVAAALEANVEGLDGATLEARIDSVTEEGDETQAAVAMAWDVPEIGPFEYANDSIRLTESGDDWLIRWSGRVIHPELQERGERLGTEVDQPDRAPILDRGEHELVSVQPAVEVGVIPAELEDREAAVSAIAEATGADAEALTRSIRASEPENFVPAITLRESDFDPIESELGAIPGVEFGERELPLAPSRDFARHVLGTVGPATAEQIEESGGELAVGEMVGQFGLQAAFDEQLAGTPDRSVVIRDAEGAPVMELETIEGQPGEPLKTTLHLKIQRAAEKAIRGVEDKAALVAVEPATGDILAVANRPIDEGLNLAMAGQYPPGSTFKVISTAALLEGGLDVEETVDCPSTFEVDGREFVNFEGSAAGAVPFSTDFSQSCNTAFVSLADRLEPRDLTRTAKDFGLGRTYDLPLDAFSGEVPPGDDEVEQAAAMIGQAEILVSPLAMAGVAATVAGGAWRPPRLLDSDPSDEVLALPDELAETLRTLMRSVVTSGTGTALAAVPGEPIGKSGTAEYGSGDPPPTHAWFIAAREDIAVAVLVEDAASGGEFAAPIAADFLTRVG